MGTWHTCISRRGNYEILVPFLECSQFSNRFAISDLTHWPTRNKTKIFTGSSVTHCFHKDWRFYMVGCYSHRNWRLLCWKSLFPLYLRTCMEIHANNVDFWSHSLNEVRSVIASRSLIWLIGPQGIKPKTSLVLVKAAAFTKTEDLIQRVVSITKAEDRCDN